MAKKNTSRQTRGKKPTKPRSKPYKRSTEAKPLVKKGIIPLNDRVLVRPFDTDEMNTTASGIIIPDTVSKEKPEQGEVVAVGEGKWNEDGDARIPLGVKVGDRVVFSKYGYDEVKYEGKEYYMLREESILAVIR
jgi:chaperonin GroES